MEAGEWAMLFLVRKMAWSSDGVISGTDAEALEAVGLSEQDAHADS